MTSSIEAKREEFRQYLEESGVVNALTQSLVKLYEEEDKPEQAVDYVRLHLCETCPTEEQYVELKSKFEETEAELKAAQREIVRLKGNMKRTPSEVELLLQDGMESLIADLDCDSLLKKYLTKEIFDKYKGEKTSNGANLLDCIQTGFENHRSNVGIYAADAESYTTFSELFDPIISDYHIVFSNDMIHPPLFWGEDFSELEDLDPSGKYIISTRVRCGRSLVEFPLNAKMSEQNYIDIMNNVRNVVDQLGEELQGNFYDMFSMDKATQDELIKGHFLFKQNDRYLESARAFRFWPTGRAIFLNHEKTFLIWVNEEDHLRLISMQSGGNLAVVYTRLVNGITQLESHLKFTRHERLGYLTFCPTNLGTTIRASVHIKIPKLSANYDQLLEIAAKYNLQVRGTSGEHSDVIGGVYDISNKRRLGINEFDVIKEMHTGIKEIIKMEIGNDDEVEEN